MHRQRLHALTWLALFVLCACVQVRHTAVIATNTVVSGQELDMLVPLDAFVPSMLEVLMALSEAGEYQMLAEAIGSFQHVTN
jgi:hypothetical protein